MSTETIPTRSNGQTIDQTWYNLLMTVLGTDFVPRTAGGVPTADVGNIGTATYPWIRAYIDTGYWAVGDVKLHHTYNALVVAGEGWMLCDGRQITQSAYDTEHGSGHWVTYIGSSPIANLYLPNFTGRYSVGKATTPQTGSSAITAVGNASNLSSLTHTHTVAHNHQWYKDGGTNAGSTYNTSGTQIPVTLAAAVGNVVAAMNSSLANMSRLSDAWTSTSTPTTDTGTLTAGNIQPDSIEITHYMRII
jgi:hypothetical protein